MKELNILVADNHPIFVEGVKTVLAQADDTIYYYKVQNVARSAQQLQFMLGKYPVDLLLLDPAMPETLPIDTLPTIKQAFSGLRVLIVTDHNDPQLVKAAMRAGADGYLLKTSSKDELLSAIQEVSEGNTYLGFGVSSNGAAARSSEDSSLLERNFAQKYQLTRREIEIIRHIGQAMTNREIGDKLFISDQTVSVHRKNIMRKLRVNSTASLIKMVFENHLESPLN